MDFVDQLRLLADHHPAADFLAHAGDQTVVRSKRVADVAHLVAQRVDPPRRPDAVCGLPRLGDVAELLQRVELRAPAVRAMVVAIVGLVLAAALTARVDHDRATRARRTAPFDPSSPGVSEGRFSMMAKHI